MSKAEDLANEIYIGDTPITRLRKKDYCDGYNQAEKDLELTWEQIYSILYFEREVLRKFGNEEHSNEEVCKEVLKRFKAMKEK